MNKTLSSLLMGCCISVSGAQTLQTTPHYKVINTEVIYEDDRKELWASIQTEKGIIGAIYVFNCHRDQLNLYLGPPSKTAIPDIVFYDVHGDGRLDAVSDQKSRFTITDILGKFTLEQKLFDAYKKLLSIEKYRR